MSSENEVVLCFKCSEDISEFDDQITCDFCGETVCEGCTQNPSNGDELDFDKATKIEYSGEHTFCADCINNS